MKKMLVIESCGGCPFHINDRGCFCEYDPDYEFEVNRTDIHPDCPLEDHNDRRKGQRRKQNHTVRVQRRKLKDRRK